MFADRSRSPLLALPLLLLACATSPESSMTDTPDPRYPRYGQVLEAIGRWEASHPAIVSVEDIGTTHLGEPIPAVRISAPDGPGDRPVLLLFAALHANETNGTHALLRLVDRLLEDDPEARRRVAGLETWVVPVANPDGYRHVFSGKPGARHWRKNGRDLDGDGEPFGPADGVDLNRNWDHFWEADPATDPATPKYKGPHPFSEPEVVALRDLILRIRPHVVVDFHSPGKVTPPNMIFWPWLFRESEEEGPDAPIYREIAQAYAARTETEEDGVFYNGDWYGYDTLPKAQNWIYRTTGACALLMEVSKRCWWEGPIVDTIAARVAEGTFALLERALDGPGIVGCVTDAKTGRPLWAEVRVREHHHPRIGPRATDRATGVFRRLLRPGPVTVMIQAPGVGAVTRRISIAPTGWTRFDVTLP